MSFLSPLAGVLDISFAFAGVLGISFAFHPVCTKENAVSHVMFCSFYHIADCSLDLKRVSGLSLVIWKVTHARRSAGVDG